MTALDDRPTLRRVTPTGRLILPASASRDAWLAARRHGIGGSDVPAILGVSDYGTPRAVYHDKRGELVDNAGEAAHWGTLLEEPIAREWARRNRSVVVRVGLVAHEDDPVMLTTLDRRITECPLPDSRGENCALEVKCRTAFKANRWHAGAPDDVLAQTLWQLAVTGYDHVHYAVLIGGNDYRQGVIRRDGHEDTLRDIVTACKRFWDAYVARGVLPPPAPEHADREADMYRRMNRDRSEFIRLDGVPGVDEALRAYEESRLVEKAAAEQKKAAQAELLRLLGPHEMATLDGLPAFGMRLASRTSADLERLSERYPEAYADCVRTKRFEQFVIEQAHRLKEAV